MTRQTGTAAAQTIESRPDGVLFATADDVQMLWRESFRDELVQLFEQRQRPRDQRGAAANRPAFRRAASKPLSSGSPKFDMTGTR